MTSSRRWLVAVSVVALACSGGASAALADERGIDPNQGQSLVEADPRTITALDATGAGILLVLMTHDVAT